MGPGRPDQRDAHRLWPSCRRATGAPPPKRFAWSDGDAVRSIVEPVAADSNGVLAHVVTVFPPTAPLMLPARSALVGVPLWEHALAVALVLGSIFTLTRFVGRVGTQGVRTRSASGVRAAWRLTRQP